MTQVSEISKHFLDINHPPNQLAIKSFAHTHTNDVNESKIQSTTLSPINNLQSIKTDQIIVSLTKASFQQTIKVHVQKTWV